MVYFNIEIYRNLFVKKEKRMLHWSLKQSSLWAQRCVWDVFEESLRCQTCVCCLLYSWILPCMMYDAYLSINVTMLEVASIWVVCSPLLAIPKLIQNPADQAQCKWLVAPQCTWGQWNPIPLCNTYIFLRLLQNLPLQDDRRYFFYLKLPEMSKMLGKPLFLISREGAVFYSAIWLSTLIFILTAVTISGRPNSWSKCCRPCKNIS